MPQLPAAVFVIRDGLGDEAPKAARVIKFLQMAQFMDDDVVNEIVGKLGKPRVEIKILFLRAAPPPRLHLLDFDIIKIAPIVLVIKINPMLDHAQYIFVHALT